MRRYVEYEREFGELEDIVIVVEARTFEAAKAYAAGSCTSCAPRR